MRVPSPGWDDPLEKMVTCSTLLAWRTPWKEEPGRLQSRGPQRVGHRRVTEHATHMYTGRPRFIARRTLQIVFTN